MASGLLIVWIGKWTKLLTNIIWKDKDYITNINFSISTDTWDMDYWDKIEKYDLLPDNNGIIKNWKEILAPSLEQIREKLDSIIWDIRMPLPDFSAKKVAGKKLYDIARKGKKWN